MPGILSVPTHSNHLSPGCSSTKNLMIGFATDHSNRQNILALAQLSLNKLKANSVCVGAPCFDQKAMVKLEELTTKSFGFEYETNNLGFPPLSAFPEIPSVNSNGLSVGNLARTLSTAFISEFLVAPSKAT